MVRRLAAARAAIPPPLPLGTATPLVFGWLMDHGQPRTLFVVIAVLMVLTIGTVIEVRRRGAPGAVGLKEPVGRTT